MADSPSTGVSILQILSVPALLAAITGVGSFLKSLWDKWSERRSLIGLQKLTDYLDLDSKRETPLLTRQTRELIDYEINIRFREFAGTPAFDSVEKVERWRRKPYLIRAMSIPPELQRVFSLRIGNTYYRAGLLRFIVTAYVSALLTLVWIYYGTRHAEAVIGSFVIKNLQENFQGLGGLLFLVVMASLFAFKEFTRLMAKVDRSAGEFVKKKDEQEKAYVLDEY